LGEKYYLCLRNRKTMRASYFRSILFAVFAGCISLLATPAMGKDFTVVLDAGHGGNDPGAIGKTAKEKNINLSIALAVGKLLNSSDPSINVVYTRRKDVFVTLQNRAQIANKCNADLFVSIHTNSLPRGRNTTMGTETYTLGLHRTQENLEVSKRENSVILIEDDYKTRYAGFNPNSAESYIIFEFMQDKNMTQSVQLASLIQQQFRTTAKRIDRGVRQAGFLVLHATSMPSVLIEVGYISTPAEERYLTSQAGINAMSRSISQAILKYKSAQKGTGKGAVAKESEPEPTQIAEGTQTKQPEKADNVTSANQPKSPAATKTESKGRPNVPTATKTNNTAQGEIIFKVQILASNRELKKNNPQLKGLSPIGFYKEGGLYKYTYGESSDYNQILRLRRKVAAKFKGAFIIAFRDGEKMNVNEAIRIYNSKKKR